MRETSREEYFRHLRQALDDLRVVKSRFQQRGDVVAVRDGINHWKETTAATMERYGAFEDGRTFRAHVDFDVLGLDGGYVLEGMEKYEHFLKDLVKTTSTGDLGPRVTYRYSLDPTTVGTVSFSRDTYSFLQNGLSELGELLLEWNQGEKIPPYEDEAKDLARMIEWGRLRLQERSVASEIVVPGV